MRKLGIKEELELEITNIKMQKIEEEKELKREDLISLANIGATMENYDIPAEGEYKDYFFEIDENYKVKVLNKLRGAKPTIDAEATLTASKTTVEIQVTASISEGTIKSIEATNGATLKESEENTDTKKIFTVSRNGTYYFKATADNGRSAVKIVNVNKIPEAPKISINKIGAHGFTISVDTEYEEGMVAEYKYYVDGSTVNIGTTNKKYKVKKLEEETVYNNIYVEAYFEENAEPFKSNVENGIKTTEIPNELSIDFADEEYSGDLETLKFLDDGTLHMCAPASVVGGWKEKRLYLCDIPLQDYTKIEIEYRITEGAGGYAICFENDKGELNYLVLHNWPSVASTEDKISVDIPQNINNDKILFIATTSSADANLYINSIKLFMKSNN